MKHIIIALLSGMPILSLTMEAPLTDALKIEVSTSKKAKLHLILESNANVFDLKEKMHASQSIPNDQDLIVYPLLTKLKFFEVRGESLSNIQQIKEIIQKFKTNKFLVCYKIINQS